MGMTIVVKIAVQVVVIAQIHNAWAVTPRQPDDRNIGMGLPVQQSDISHAQWLRGAMLLSPLRMWSYEENLYISIVYKISPTINFNRGILGDTEMTFGVFQLSNKHIVHNQ